MANERSQVTAKMVQKKKSSKKKGTGVEPTRTTGKSRTGARKGPAAKKSLRQKVGDDTYETVEPAISGWTEKPGGPVVQVKLGGVDVSILGTAHVSPESVSDVESFFEKGKGPDGVAVELCSSRFENIRNPDRWKNQDLVKVIKEKKIGLLASSLILSSFQKKIGETTGVKPGQEMITACDLAEENGAELYLADRDIQTTLSRAWGMVGIWSKLWLTSTLMASLIVKEDVDPEEIEKMKQEDVLTDLFSQLPSRYDSVKNVIIDERDSYLAEMIRRSAVDVKAKGGKTLLAVVGAGHLKGIERVLQKSESVNLEALMEKPSGLKLSTILFWASFVLLGLAFSYYISKGGMEAAINSLTVWVLGRSIGSGIGAIVARAHPYTVFITMISAPVSIFIPGSRLWMFSAITEVGINKPRVEDFESIATDTEDFKHLAKAIYKNRVMHLFWVILLVSTGLTIGNLVFWKTVLGGVWKSLF